MKKYILFLIIIQISFGKLIPTPLITDPEPIQRFTGTIADTIFETHLFGQCYGISFVEIRDAVPENWLGVISDPVLDDLVYILGVDSFGERYSKFIKGFDDWQNPQYFDRPMGVACDSTIFNGEPAKYFVYTADCNHNRIVRSYYNSNDEEMYFYDYMLEGMLSEPEDVACVSIPGGGSYLVIADTWNHCIRLIKVNPNLTYSLLNTYGSEGTGVDQFWIPTSATIIACEDSSEYYRIYVVDQRNFRIVSLLYNTTNNSIVWERVFEDNTMQAVFLSVTSNPYYCVYVTDVWQHCIWVFSPGLQELLYTYGSYGYNEHQFITPRDICIYQDEIAITESWANRTGIQYFKIIPEIREFYPSPAIFDATEDSVKINFRVDETAHYLTMTVAGRNIFENQYFTPGYDSVYWDGRDAVGKVVLPGNYEIKIYCQDSCIGITNVTVKGTQVNRPLSANEHWTEAGEPYVITGNVVVEHGKLTIDPGVKVMPTGNYKLIINPGILIAEGTALNKILFTPHRKLLPHPDPVAKGFWKSIKFCGNTDNDTLLLKYCKIEAAGSENGNIYLATSHGVVDIDHCEIIKSSSYGIWLYSQSTGNLNISNSIFEEDSIPGRCLFTGAFGFGNGNEYLKNTVNKIEVYPCSLRYDMTLKKQGIPFWFRKTTTRKNYEIYGDTNYVATLTIEPGTEIEFADSTALEIGRDYWFYNQRGRLICEGLEDDTIRLALSSDLVFRGGKSDEKKKSIDTPKEKDASEDSLFWRGLRFGKRNQPVDTSIIKYTSIEYAGLDTAAIIFGDSTSLSIIDSRIFKSKNYGIWMPNARSYDNLLISNCLFEEDSIPVRTAFNNLTDLHTCLFSNNIVDAIEVVPYYYGFVWRDITIHHQDVPYWFLRIPSTNKEFRFYGDVYTCATVTIKPGTKMMFADSTILKGGHPGYPWRAKIIAEGTEQDSIIFTAA